LKGVKHGNCFNPTLPNPNLSGTLRYVIDLTNEVTQIFTQLFSKVERCETWQLF